jgi:hypothetical protein
MLLPYATRLAHNAFLKNVGSSFLSTGTKYVAGWCGAVSDGQAREIITTVTMTLKSKVDDPEGVYNCLAASKKIHADFRAQLEKIQEEFPDASVRGSIDGDQWNTLYVVREEVEEDGLSPAGSDSGSGYDGFGGALG